ATVLAIARPAGPVLRASLPEPLGWRAVFAVNLPLGVIAAGLALRVPQAPIVRAGKFRPDIVGALLFSLATLALLFALSSGGHRFAWLSREFAVLAAAALPGYALLVRWDRPAADPVTPVRFLAV